MSEWHGYIGIENLALTDAQKATLVQALSRLGTRGNGNPCVLNHMRVRLDNDAAIWEAAFDSDHLTVAAWKSRLASIFSVSASSIASGAVQTQYGPVVTFSYGGTARVRALLFGGVDAGWSESNAAVLAYLKANSAAWESPI